MRSIHNEVIEIIALEEIVVVVEQFAGFVRQTNRFRNATNSYYFYFNHDIILG